MTPDERKALEPLLNAPDQPLGLRELQGDRHGSIAFPHPLIAEELLRICVSSPELLRDAGVSQCVGSFDLELSVLERVFQRDDLGLPEVIPVVEDLVVSALRVDPREAPRNYEARERIVMMVERAPDSVFDNSQIFLHHLAKSRRHLAADPPTTEYWQDVGSVREQLELAEIHLENALKSVRLDDEERQENPLNLYVLLALTLSVRAKVERECGGDEMAERLINRAHENFQSAQALDPDNTYVLENFARLKLRQASETAKMNCALMRSKTQRFRMSKN